MKKTLTFLAAMLLACGSNTPDQNDATPNDAASEPPTDDATIDAPDVADSEQDGDVADVEAEAEAGPVSAPWGVDLGNGLASALAVDRSHGMIGIGGPLGSNGNWGATLIGLLDAQGTTAWLKKLYPGPYVHALAFDSTGALYVAASTGANVDFGGGPTSSQGDVIVKYDASGTFQWQLGPSLYSNFRAIAVRSNDDVVVAGMISGPQDFGGGTINPSSPDVLLLEVSPSMSYVSAATFGGAGMQSAYTLTLDSNDAVVLGGEFEGTVDFGGGTMIGPTPGNSAWNLFIAKLDSSWKYIHQIDLQSATAANVIAGIAVDSSGSLYVCGTVGDQISLGGKTLYSAGGSDAFFGKLDSSLAHVWSKRFGDAAQQACNAVAVADDGTPVFAGMYKNAINFGLGYLTLDGAYAARFDPSGAPIADVGYQMGPLAGYMRFESPDFVIAGTCSSYANLGVVNVNCASQTSDIFVARIQPP